MNQTEIIEKTAEYAKKTLENEGAGHDWWHVYRVWQTAKTIAEEENADQFIVQLAALLHDVGDPKLHNGDTTIAPKLIKAWLEKTNTNEKTIQQVTHIVENMSYSAPLKKNVQELTLEGKIVQDSDRLDAIGAIGIARVFAVGGKMGKRIYDPSKKYRKNLTYEDYTKRQNTSINHFYEKLLKLKNKMNTKTGKKLARERHAYMEDFLKRFYEEWDGKA